LPHDDIFLPIVKKPVEIPRGKLESRLRFDSADVGKKKSKSAFLWGVVCHHLQSIIFKVEKKKKIK